MANKTRFSHLSESELYAQMSTERWKRHDPETRLELYQEAENRQAAKLGRESLTVTIFEPEGEKKKGLGYFSKLQPDKLFINARYIDGKPTLLSNMSGANGLNSIIHEGRHAYQHAVADGKAACPDELKRKMWKLNFSCYRNGNGAPPAFVVYTQQEVERDARRYAEDELVRIAGIIRESSGNVDMSFEDVIYESRRKEYAWANGADESKIMEIIEARDKEAREALKALFPDEDMSGVSMFGGYLEDYRKRMADSGKESKADSVDALIDQLKEAAAEKIADNPADAQNYRDTHKVRGF